MNIEAIISICGVIRVIVNFDQITFVFVLPTSCTYFGCTDTLRLHACFVWQLANVYERLTNDDEHAGNTNQSNRPTS